MEHIYWGKLITFYLFCAGISAGALIVSVCASIIDNIRYEGIIKTGAYIAPFPISFGTLSLVFDLEKPLSFWKLFTTFQPDSIMSIGAWLILFFSIVSLIYLYKHLPGVYSGRRPGSLLKTAALLSAFGVSVYTGILLCTLTARPFWNTPMVPMLFFISAVIDGAAAIGFILFFFKPGKPTPQEMRKSKSFLHNIDIVLLLFFVVALTLFLIGLHTSSTSAAEAVRIITGGHFTFHFWFYVILAGVVIPAIYELYGFLSHEKNVYTREKERTWIAGLVCTLILLGGYMLRYIVIYSGQMTHSIVY